MMGFFYLGRDTQGFTLVASKFAVVSFLCVLDAVSKKQSEHRGENKQYPVLTCSLIVYSLRFWKNNLH